MVARAAEDTRKSAQSIASSINKKYGAGTVVVASEAVLPPARLSTGSLAFDVALGGGWPKNQFAEVVGNESAGKTSVILKTVAAAQKADPDFHTTWLAAESYDAAWAAMLGVDNTRVTLIEENIAEYAFAISLEYLENRATDMLVIDSIPALIPLDEDEKNMDEWAPGAFARRMNLFMRKASKAGKRSLVNDDRPFNGILVNQWRNKIGVMHGDPRTTPGGMGKNFWMWARVEFRRDEWITDPESKAKVGQVIKGNVFKMKGAKPGAVATVDFYFDDANGVDAGNYDVYKEILNLAQLYDVIIRRGNAYVYEDQRFPGGKAGFYEAMRQDDQLYARVRKEVLDLAHSRAEPESEPVRSKRLRRPA